MSTASSTHPAAANVVRVVHETELLDRGVPPLDLLQLREQLHVLAQGARDRPQATDVLRVTPPRVVTPAIRVGNEGDAHGAPRSLRDVHSASNDVTSSASIHPCGAGA
jgi:hypothetical protein